MSGKPGKATCCSRTQRLLKMGSCSRCPQDLDQITHLTQKVAALGVRVSRKGQMVANRCPQNHPLEAKNKGKGTGT